MLSSVAMDPDGDFVVTRQSEGQDGSDFGVYAQRYKLDGPVQLIGTTPGITGTNLADVIAVTEATPAGGATRLEVTRNGVIYSYDLAKVTAITINGLDGNDSLTIGSRVTRSATLTGGAGRTS